MYGLGFVVGPALGGWLGGIWLRLPFVVAGRADRAQRALWLAGAAPRACRASAAAPLPGPRANAAGSLKLFAENGWTLRLGIAWCCTWVALGSQQSSFILSNQMRFGWTIGENGLVLAMGGVAQGPGAGRADRPHHPVGRTTPHGDPRLRLRRGRLCHLRDGEPPPG